MPTPPRPRWISWPVRTATGLTVVVIGIVLVVLTRSDVVTDEPWYYLGLALAIAAGVFTFVSTVFHAATADQREAGRRRR